MTTPATPDRERKLRITYAALWTLLIGLLIMLIASRNSTVAGVAVGVFAAFATAVVGVVTAFVVGNVKVHGIQEKAASALSGIIGEKKE